MKILAIPVLASLALMSAPVQAQSTATAPLSKRERIDLCKKKRDVPLRPTEDQPLSLGGKDGAVSRPTLLYHPPGFLGGTNSKVIVEALIDEDGCVRQAKVAQTGGADLDAEAIKAIKQWVFLPAMKDGHPVRVFYYLTINTRMQ